MGTNTTTGAPAKSDTGRTSLATVEALYAAFGEFDTEAALACFHDDIEIRQSEELPWGGTYRGKQEALVFFGTLLSHIRTKVSIDQFIVAGDTVVEIGRTCGHAVATGREFAIDEVHVFRVRDGRIDRMHAVVDNAAMLAAIEP